MIGFMLDSARALERRSYYTRFIDFIAERGCDTLLLHFSDDQGCSLRFDAFPECASPNAYSKSQVRELVDYARSRGIAIIPELASLGHTRYLTHTSPSYADLSETDDWYSSICPVSPRTRTLIAELLDEVLAAFDSPIIHVGLDEVNLGGHPLTQHALQTASATDLFIDYVRFLHTHLTSRGRRMMMWGDSLVANDDVLQRVPRDVLIANWQYDPDVSPDATLRLVEAGFEVVSCPALISHNQTILPGESFAYPNLRRMASYGRFSGGVTGTLTTIWTPTRFMSETLWPSIDYAAAVMREPGASVRDRGIELGRSFFGIADPTLFADAVDRLARFAPRRDRWLSLMRLEAQAIGRSNDLDAGLRDCRSLSRLLLECRGDVTREHDAFDRLVLLTQLFEHVWKRAIAVRDATVTPELLAASTHIADQLAMAWDQERFADDPRKHCPSTPADEGDSLLFAFAKGNVTLRQTAFAFQ
jgi:hypothetical protein